MNEQENLFKDIKDFDSSVDIEDALPREQLLLLNALKKIEEQDKRIKVQEEKLSELEYTINVITGCLISNGTM